MYSKITRNRPPLDLFTYVYLRWGVVEGHLDRHCQKMNTRKY